VVVPGSKGEPLIFIWLAGRRRTEVGTKPCRVEVWRVLGRDGEEEVDAEGKGGSDSKSFEVKKGNWHRIWCGAKLCQELGGLY
jgi:hypothetical protein